MKRLLILLALLLVCSPVAALSFTLQKSGDMDYVNMTLAGGSNVYVVNASGGNNYAGDGGSATVIGNKYPQTSSYFACTMFTAYATGVRLYDSDMTLLGEESDSCGTGGAGTTAPYRHETVVSAGGTVTVYCDGIVQGTDTVTNYPSYIGQIVQCDDIVYGSTENRYIFSMPFYGEYEIIKDTANPANSGFGWTNGTIITAGTMTTTWGRSNITYAGNESIILRTTGTQVVYDTKYTGLRTAGVEYWNTSALTASAAPYGLYEITIPGSGATSDPIVYTSIGATLTLDRKTYTTGDIAIATYEVEAAYRGLGAYRIDTMDVYGNVIDTQLVDGTLGTVEIPFSESDPLGVYYTVLIVSAAGSDTWLAYDYAELNGYVSFNGYVNGAETLAPIAAHVNISQGATIFDYDTVAGDGYQYNTTYPIETAFLAGSAITTNVTAVGYRQYTYTFTPMVAKTIDLNFTLIPLAPTYDVGLAIGGVAREILYGQPIPSVHVDVTNTTNAEYYSTTANIVGYYLCDYGATCTLTHDRVYQVWGSKTNYDNSSIYNVTAAGEI